VPYQQPTQSIWAVAGVCLVVAAGVVALLQLIGLKNDVARISEGQAAIQRDIQDVRTMVMQRPGGGAPGGGAAAAEAAPNPIVSIADARVKGRPDAPVTLVEFSDYQ
jgi:hypothetical protein